MSAVFTQVKPTQAQWSTTTLNEDKDAVYEDDCGAALPGVEALSIILSSSKFIFIHVYLHSEDIWNEVEKARAYQWNNKVG